MHIDLRSHWQVNKYSCYCYKLKPNLGAGVHVSLMMGQSLFCYTAFAVWLLEGDNPCQFYHKFLANFSVPLP
ncbi:hypothetical protein GDO81_018671 [Engystomops pustulosus]|uniref:Uncharacterized protein n=1 Tax=Engystomops pustulosus TaxID=76066 RepID=A0AAV6ZK21_ENGPU|nr:hypothetical protein GDO81_018671 [Engystomops pustulosus]